jgi:hypothetical protein
MKEKEFQGKFTKWAKVNLQDDKKDLIVEVTELKITNTKRFSIKNLKPHQARNLYNAKHFGIYYKIPDVGYDQKPFDGFFIKGPSYVCIMFHEPKKPKDVYFIDIDVFLKIKDKSITEEQARNLASKVEVLR